MNYSDNDPRYKTGTPVCDALRFLCDASFAVLPRDAAHKLGEFEKNFWGSVRWLADRSIECIDDALAGGDRLALLLQPPRDARFDDRLTELGNDDVDGHGIL
jgi:hypothetical protein